jgi:hypothetical protein
MSIAGNSVNLSTVTESQVAELELQDSIQGSGYYTFSYTFDSIDTPFQESDYIVSGVAPVYCTDSVDPLPLG